ncbi:hypothetical protein M9R32_03100 [Paenisporosarcina quisquiliarum]|uniref:Uncharacterized protein n=1 Tax=Paenisporosarcina quisquiliarum TaxID=365346 RepID=A0A9X3LFV1_9BACL|nr:hypothetical protein [Paenisporosarcina quisquiliarum]MCZ8536181.1 hypothetical protein [Paenisporosarcina quisquiliarum]
MKKMLNERGYALLIVLFTIIIFLSMSAVFMSASLNHVNQEQTVDKNNQAVVAAELGVKYVESHMQNQAEILYEKHLIELQTAVNNLKNCNGKSPNSNCKTQSTINSLISQQLDKYQVELTSYYQSFKTMDQEIIENKVDYSILDETIGLLLETTTVEGVTYYKLPFSVEGNTNHKPAVLKNELLVPKPNFVSSITSIDNPIPVPEATNSSELNKYLFTPPASDVNCKDIKPLTEGAICHLSGVDTIASVLGNTQTSIDYSKITIIAEDIQASFCPGGSCISGYSNLKVYSSKDISIDKIKPLSQLSLFLNAIINIDTNGNNYAGTAVIKGVNAENHFKNIRGNVFITGDNSDQIPIKIDKHTDAKFGKLCINLDGIDIANSTFEVANGNSKHDNVYYYSSNSSRRVPDAERYSGTYKEFVNYCIGTINTPIPPPVKEVTATYIEKNSDLKVNVKYKP